MEYSTNFSDYQSNPKELIGKYVLIKDRSRSMIKKIERTTKTAFGVSGSSSLYSLVSGTLKGSDIWHSGSASIISESDARKLIQQWNIEKEERDMRVTIQDSLPSITHKTLSEIVKLIQNEKNSNNS